MAKPVTPTVPRRLGWEPALTVVVTVVAAVLMARSLDAKSLWIDEAISVHVAQFDPRDLFRFVFDEEMNMALYHLLLSAWTSLGTGEAEVRALSVAFAVASVPAMYLLGARLSSPRVGVTAALLLGLNPAVFSYGREARSYALTLLLVVLASFLFVLAVQTGRRAAWAAYTAVAVLAVYAHLFAALVLVAHGLSLIVVRGRPAVGRRTLVATGGAIVLLLLPVAYYLTKGETGRTTDSGTTASDVPNLFLWFAGGNRPLTALYVLAAFAALAVAARSRRAATWPYAFVVLWLAVPVVLALGISITIDPLFVFRYLLPTLPALLLLVALGISAIGRSVLFAVALVAVSALSLRATLACHPGCSTSTQDFRAATAHVLAHARRGDTVLFDPPYLEIPFAYYARETGAKGLSLSRCGILLCSAPEARVVESSSVQAWLLVDEGDPNATRQLALPPQYRRARETLFPAHLRVVRYVRLR